MRSLVGMLSGQLNQDQLYLYAADNEFGENTAQDVGSEISKNAPDVDLTQNPQQLGQQAGDAIKDAGKEVAKQNPLNFITMLDLPSPQVESYVLLDCRF